MQIPPCRDVSSTLEHERGASVTTGDILRVIHWQMETLAVSPTGSGLLPVSLALESTGSWLPGPAAGGQPASTS
jgi:hypothetical protein